MSYATNYIIERKVEGNPNWYQVKTVGSTVRKASFDVEPGVTTRWRVRAVREKSNHVVQGAYSSYNRNLKLLNSSGKKINSKSILGIKFRYDNVKYILLIKPREEVTELYLAE